MVKPIGFQGQTQAETPDLRTSSDGGLFLPFTTASAESVYSEKPMVDGIKLLNGPSYRLPSKGEKAFTDSPRPSSKNGVDAGEVILAGVGIFMLGAVAISLSMPLAIGFGALGLLALSGCVSEVDVKADRVRVNEKLACDITQPSNTINESESFYFHGCNSVNPDGSAVSPNAKRSLLLPSEGKEIPEPTLTLWTTTEGNYSANIDTRIRFDQSAHITPDETDVCSPWRNPDTGEKLFILQDGKKVPLLDHASIAYQLFAPQVGTMILECCRDGAWKNDPENAPNGRLDEHCDTYDMRTIGAPDNAHGRWNTTWMGCNLDRVLVKPELEQQGLSSNLLQGGGSCEVSYKGQVEGPRSQLMNVRLMSGCFDMIRPLTYDTMRSTYPQTRSDDHVNIQSLFWRFSVQELGESQVREWFDGSFHVKFFRFLRKEGKHPAPTVPYTPAPMSHLWINRSACTSTSADHHVFPPICGIGEANELIDMTPSAVAVDPVHPAVIYAEERIFPDAGTSNQFSTPPQYPPPGSPGADAFTLYVQLHVCAGE